MNTSAEARVIAAFTFIVSLLLGAWGALDRLVVESPFLPGEPEVGRFLVTLVPFVATAVAFRATKATQAAWAQALGGAAVMLGGLSCIAAVLYFVVSWNL